MVCKTLSETLSWRNFYGVCLMISSCNLSPFMYQIILANLESKQNPHDNKELKDRDRDAHEGLNQQFHYSPIKAIVIWSYNLCRLYIIKKQQAHQHENMISISSNDHRWHDFQFLEAQNGLSSCINLSIQDINIYLQQLVHSSWGKRYKYMDCDSEW